MVGNSASREIRVFVVNSKNYSVFPHMVGCIFDKTFIARILFLFSFLLSPTHPSPSLCLCFVGFCTHPAGLNIAGCVTLMTPKSLQIRMIFCHTSLTFSWKNLLPKRRKKKRHVRGSEVLSSLRAKDIQYLLSFNRPPI